MRPFPALVLLFIVCGALSCGTAAGPAKPGSSSLGAERARLTHAPEAFPTPQTGTHAPFSFALPSPLEPAPVPGDAAATARVRFYAVIYSYQSPGLLRLPRRTSLLNPPKRTHTWARFLRTEGDFARGPLAIFDISWLAADTHIGIIQEFVQRTEHGMNFSHAATLAIARRDKNEFRRTPLLEISPALYQAAWNRKEKLDRASRDHSIRYEMIDSQRSRSEAILGTPGASLNCVHAISDAIVDEYGAPKLRSGLARGYDAGSELTEYFWPFVVSPRPELDALYELRAGP